MRGSEDERVRPGEEDFGGGVGGVSVMMALYLRTERASNRSYPVPIEGEKIFTFRCKKQVDKEVVTERAWKGTEYEWKDSVGNNAVM